MSESPSTDPRAGGGDVRPESVDPAGQAPADEPRRAEPDTAPRRPDPGAGEEEREQPVVRDKRRLDPVTGRLRQPSAGTTPSAAPGGPAVTPAGPAQDVPVEGAGAPAAAVEDPRVAELTDQLQRLSAEYANYRRRKEREQAELVERVTGDVLTRLLGVLDDVERARAHGDLDGAFRSVGEALEKVVSSLGLVPYGEKGEPFDPKVHDALVSQPSPDVAEPAVAEVYARGYRLGDRVLRAAQVVVAEPA